MNELSEEVASQLEMWKPVTVTGKVKAQGPATILAAATGALLVQGEVASAADRPTPVPLKLPKTTKARESYMQALDGMLVSLPRALVIDPTGSGEFIAVDKGVTGPGAVPTKDKPLPMVAVTDRLGFGAQVNAGTEIEGVAGPLKYDDGAVKHWHVMQNGKFTKLMQPDPRQKCGETLMATGTFRVPTSQPLSGALARRSQVREMPRTSTGTEL